MPPEFASYIHEDLEIMMVDEHIFLLNDEDLDQVLAAASVKHRGVKELYWKNLSEKRLAGRGLTLSRSDQECHSLSFTPVSLPCTPDPDTRVALSLLGFF